MRFLHFILSHSVFIAFCAVALCVQTTVLLHLAHDPYVYAFIFFSTLCSYNFYWLLSKYYFSGRSGHAGFLKKNISFVFIFFIAAGGMIYCITFLDNILSYVAGAIFFTLLYSLPLWPFSFSVQLQKAGFFKTVLLAFTWAYVTVILPSVSVIRTEVEPVLLLLAARFFFMLLLCIIFDMRDISVDKMHGLHSLATDMKRKTLSVVILVCFLLYLISGILVRNYFHDNMQSLALAVTGIIVWIVFQKSKQKRGFLFYYFLVDGLMFVGALLTYLAAMV